MSAASSLRNAPTSSTAKPDHQISLIDQEQGEGRAERNHSEAHTPPRDNEASTQSPITRKLTQNSSNLQQSFKRQWTKRKYAKYERDRYELDDDDENTPPPPDEDPAAATQIGEPASAVQTSYLERSRAKAKNLIRRKKTLGQGKEDRDSVIEILYENQRGIFLFGVPKYSSSSLLPSDPSAWQTSRFTTSPVDIRNAQPPDPSWEWSWKSWYVDMSRDVDEEGWEYSFKFTGGFAWHGNHPWFHSFVRRRRWLRLRRRREVKHRTKEKSHELTAEYFTIHPKTLRPGSEEFASKLGEAEMERLRERIEEEEELKDAEKFEIEDIGSLIHILKRAAVDREKLVAVRKFVDAGGEELYYLSDRMEEIMSLFIYQSSRKQLLTELLRHFDQAQTRRESLTGHSHDDKDAQREHEKAQQQTENLMNAIKAADEQVKRLEYWSDIKGMAHQGDTLQEEGQWTLERWQGLSPTASAGGKDAEAAFASKQRASEGAPQLHLHPEHQHPAQSAKGDDDGEDDGESAVTAPSKKSSGSRVQAVKHPPGGNNSNKESSTEQSEGYVTAAESASDLPGTRNQNLKNKGNGKSPISNLDGPAPEDEDNGHDEEDDDEDDLPTPTATPSTPAFHPTREARSARPSVQIVEPVPEPISDLQRGGRGGGGDGS